MLIIRWLFRIYNTGKFSLFFEKSNPEITPEETILDWENQNGKDDNQIAQQTYEFS